MPPLPESKTTPFAEVKTATAIEVREQLLDFGVTTIGLDSPLGIGAIDPTSLKHPNVLYHGYHRTNGGFKFDEFFDAANARGAGGEFLGRGLYTGTQELANLYAEKASRGRHEGAPGVVPIIPVNAKVLDLNNPDARKNVPHIVHESLREYTNLELSRPKDSPLRPSPATVARVRELLKSDFSLTDLFSDARLNSHDTNFARKFLANYLGIDGVRRNILPSVDFNNTHNVVAFWRLDNIGDQKTWVEREKRLLVAATACAALSGVSIAEISTGIEIDKHAKARTELEHKLDGGNDQLTTQEALLVVDAINKGVTLLSPEQSEELAKVIASDHLSPYEKVRQMSAVSPVLRRLLLSSVGVWEGYSLHEHTQAVLEQFRRNIRSNLLSNEVPEQRKFGVLVEGIFCLQDIGKPLAHLLESKEAQEKYNKALAANLLTSTPFSPQAKQFMTDVIGQDSMGRLIKKPQRTAADYDATATEIDAIIERNYGFIPPWLTMITIFAAHQSDAAAYTSLARYRGQDGRLRYALPGLDRVFRMNPDIERMTHIENTEKIIREEIAPRIEKLRAKRVRPRP